MIEGCSDKLQSFSPLNCLSLHLERLKDDESVRRRRTGGHVAKSLRRLKKPPSGGATGDKDKPTSPRSQTALMDNPMSFDYVRQKLTLTTTSGGATSGEDEANDEDSWTSAASSAYYSPTSPTLAGARGPTAGQSARRRPKSILKTKSKYDTAEASSPSSEVPAAAAAAPYATFYQDQTTQRD